MPTEPPLLTVAIPTYNCAHYLPDAIGSVMRQGLDDFELLILDNASEDNTEEVVRSFEGARIRYIRNSSNLGSRENGNRCVLNARGRYIKFLCADDVLLDGVLKKQLEVLERSSEVVLVSCDNFITDERLQIETVFHAFPGVCSGERLINACLSWISNYIGGPSNVMFRREQVADLVSDNSYNAVSDWKFYLQLLERGGYANIGEVGYLYRKHPTSDTQMNCPVALRASEHLRLVSEFGGWNPLSCFKAVKEFGPEGWRAVRTHWRDACKLDRVARAAVSFSDLARTYYTWHFAPSKNARRV
jgi:glycosyltransferase involved in cell wall biosynthesis